MSPERDPGTGEISYVLDAQVEIDEALLALRILLGGESVKEDAFTLMLRADQEAVQNAAADARVNVHVSGYTGKLVGRLLHINARDAAAQAPVGHRSTPKKKVGARS